MGVSSEVRLVPQGPVAGSLTIKGVATRAGAKHLFQTGWVLQAGGGQAAGRPSCGRQALPYPLVRTPVICRREVTRAAATWVLANSATGTFLPSRVEKRTRWPLSIFVWTL